MDEVIEKYALENAVRYEGEAKQGAVIGSVIKEDPSAKKNIKELQKKVGKVLKKVNSMPLDEQKKRLEELAPELLEKKKYEEKGLFDNFEVEGEVVTAFPPEPSKYPHIGHAKSLFVNYEFAKEHDGKFILRFEDTNPDLAEERFYKIHEENYKWLGIKPDKTEYASDYMEEFYKQAKKLIELGKAYVCICPQDIISDNRQKGEACDCRYKHMKEDLLAWSRMASMKEGEAILRLKGDLKSKNSAMRDPTLFRIIRKSHPRTKNKFVVWPTYDFENAVMDGLQGVTHRFRTKEFELRNEVQRYLQRLLGLSETEIYEYARFNLEGVESSGRKIRKLIEDKKLSGWDDPSLTTLVALRRRGFLPEAIKEFVLSTGITKSESTLTWDDFILHNKRILDSECNRYFFIDTPKRVRVQDAPELKVELKLHPENSKAGKRKFQTDELFYITKDDRDGLKHGKLYRLMGCLNFKRKNGYYIFDSTDLDKYKEKGDSIMHWLPFNDDNVEVEILMPDKSRSKGLAEKLVKKLKVGDTIQFERFGFCKLEQKGKKLSFIYTHG